MQQRAGRSGCLGGLIYFAFVVSVSIILACVGWMAASDVLALNKEPVTATVTLDKAEFQDVTISYTDSEGNAKERAGHQVSVGYVAKQLKDAGIIKYKGLFQLYCSVSHAKTKIDPGTYELSTNYDYRALVKKMQVGSGAMVTTKVTIPEGYTMEQIFRKLEDENVCSYDDLMDAAANYSYNYSFLDQSMQGDAKRLEGFLFPAIQVVVFILLVAAPAFIYFTEAGGGPGAKHAAVLISLAAGLIVGALAQRTRLCMVGGIRDVVLFREPKLLMGFGAILISALVCNLILTGVTDGAYFHLAFEGQPIAHTDGLWNCLGMVLVGFGCVLLGGCPLRQLVLSGEGSSDSAVTVLGLIVGAAFAHNFGLASSAEGPTANGKIAVVIGLAVVAAIGCLNTFRKKA